MTLWGWRYRNESASVNKKAAPSWYFYFFLHCIISMVFPFRLQWMDSRRSWHGFYALAKRFQPCLIVKLTNQLLSLEILVHLILRFLYYALFICTCARAHKHSYALAVVKNIKNCHLSSVLKYRGTFTVVWDIQS